MEFDLDEMFRNIRSSPSIIDVSSESCEEFMVEPGDTQTLDERFPVRGPNTDAMSAFMNAAAATLFPISFLTNPKTSSSRISLRSRDN